MLDAGSLCMGPWTETDNEVASPSELNVGCNNGKFPCVCNAGLGICSAKKQNYSTIILNISYNIMDIAIIIL